MRSFLVSGAALLSAFASIASEAGPLPVLERVARSGLAQPLFPVIGVDPTCKPMGKVPISLVETPQNGRVTIVDGMDFTNFGPDNPRFRCNTRKFPSQVLTYTSAPGYVGEDKFSVELIDSFGAPLRREFHIVVR
ncbi:hypothetical protein [Methylobacterium sp. Leaf118]|uniref:hypothetical protein n=1 Tax=Methylobacterium sp. Leaf118 TaxID=2876562 RepID=UPI001E462F88|nr:hypothetical protein [Methylobacterium sp. Leaf118]